MNKLGTWGLSVTLALGAAAVGLPAQTQQSPAPSIRWANCLAQKPDWYGTDEAVRIADNVLLYQHDTGGWPKNVEMTSPLTEHKRSELLQDKKKSVESTIDNGATYTQISYLARVYGARRLERHREALIKGIDYLLAAQYENGGWPQFYPNLSDYYKHITFNDGAMIGVMRVLREIAENGAAYRFVDESRRRKARQAVQKGIECILKTQIVVQGNLTVWCAQHDEITLAPAKARTYELVSLSGGESVDIVRFLMDIEHPGTKVVESINSAIAWFRKSAITGIKIVDVSNPSEPREFDRMVIQDPAAEPLWARFYDIGTNRPIFVGRDGIVKYRLADIEAERRNNYRWYVNSPALLLSRDYPVWQKKWSR